MEYYIDKYAQVYDNLKKHSPDYPTPAYLKSIIRIGNIEFVQEAEKEGIPIPHTPLWGEAVASSPYDLVSEPLFHNNTLLPCWDEEQRREFTEVKARVLEIRRGSV